MTKRKKRNIIITLNSFYDEAACVDGAPGLTLDEAMVGVSDNELAHKVIWAYELLKKYGPTIKRYYRELNKEA